MALVVLVRPQMSEPARIRMKYFGSERLPGKCVTIPFTSDLLAGVAAADLRRAEAQALLMRMETDPDMIPT